MTIASFVTIGAISAASLWAFYSSAVTICSFLHTTLPPWDCLSDFPKAQQYYKLLVYVIGYIALNARSTVYKSIAVSNGTQK